jgi:multicomponent Na+:H+ antiporter subunit B
MRSIILRLTARVLLPLLLLFALFLFVRGHNEPGGGFVAGLVAAAAWALFALAYNTSVARRAMHADPRLLIGAGLVVALGSGAVGLLRGGAFLAGLWGPLGLPGLETVEVGSPVFFDLGVFLVVVGVTLTIIFAMAEEE